MIPFAENLSSLLTVSSVEEKRERYIEKWFHYVYDSSLVRQKKGSEPLLSNEKVASAVITLSRSLALYFNLRR